MKERLVEDWLINTGERGFEIPFCQILLAKGFRVLRVSHSPYEHGKDVLAVTPKGELHAYQLKQGDVDLATFEKHGEQIRALVEADVEHPSIPRGKAHKPFFVTTGTIKDPVVDRILKMNAQWKRRGIPCLGYLDRRQLHADFLSLASDFWPVEPPKIRAFRSLYLATGRADLDKPELAKFLVELLTVPAGAKKSGILRRISAANIFTSYLLSEFYRNEDHWSVFQGWIMTAAHIAWVAESHKLLDSTWERPFSLAVDAAEEALALLVQEATKQDALSPHGFELDELTRSRLTICTGAIAAFNLIQLHRKPGIVIPQDLTELVAGFVRNGRLLLWGEGAIAHFLSTIWFLETTPAHSLSEHLICSMIDAIIHINAHRGNLRLTAPYRDPDDVFVKLFEQKMQIPSQVEKESKESYTLESLVALATRRMLRQNLARRWRDISWVTLASFTPKTPSETLLWRCSRGKERSYFSNQTQSWSKLLQQSRQQETKKLAAILVSRPDFALMFLLVYPHRVGVQLIKMLDAWMLN